MKAKDKCLNPKYDGLFMYDDVIVKKNFLKCQ